MSFSTSYSPESKQLSITVSGQFDLTSHTEFRECYESAASDTKTYCLNMADASCLDGSVLGMLLLLRDHVGGKKSTICIESCNAQLKELLLLSNFQRLFTIH